MFVKRIGFCIDVPAMISKRDLCKTPLIHDRYWDHDHKDSQGVTKKIWSILPVLFNKSKSRFNWVNKEGLKRKAVD